MSWLRAGSCVVVLMALTDCPSEFGKEGRISKAVHKDTKGQLVIKRCAEGRRKEVCEGPYRDPDKCRECGG
ncbi:MULTISPECIES: hypothetical protein [Stigmatella]|uniref:Uncharacterized protein n=2 Tax=Stigmatella TaxID=40 RepID=A0A1H8CWY0_STIAU|nr:MULTISPECIES: hypothetical protein [Stigmatella]SEM98954.1 hypothetical protein SAMN05444354_12792 [Stigmatella aurantiaca]SEU30250.1 hypothetical protein SAMN05443639_11566 [Stigmatella erecta]